MDRYHTFQTPDPITTNHLYNIYIHTFVSVFPNSLKTFSFPFQCS